MLFTAYEKNLLQEYMMENETKLENLNEFIEVKPFNFLKSENNLNTLHDNLLLNNSNRYRPYEVMRLTKFLTPNFDMKTFLNDILGQLSPPYFTFIDFHFLALGNSKESDDITVNQNPSFKLQKASKASAMNTNVKIFSSSDFDNLFTEYEDKDIPALLNDTFIHHCELFEYENSGLVPYQLLSLVVHVQKFKPNFF